MSKISQIDKARKRKAKRQRQRSDGKWYELQEYFNPDHIRPVQLPETQGYRTFVHGRINGIVIVEIDGRMSNEKVRAFGKALGESGIRAFIVSSNVRFMRLREVTPEEAEVLSEHDKEATGTVFAPDSRVRPELDGDGDRGGEREAHADLVRGGENQPEAADARSTEDDCEEGPSDGS